MLAADSALIHAPHHDGSGLYVRGPGTPRLGDELRVRLRVPADPAAPPGSGCAACATANRTSSRPSGPGTTAPSRGSRRRWTWPTPCSATGGTWRTPTTPGRPNTAGSTPPGCTAGTCRTPTTSGSTPAAARRTGSRNRSCTRCSPTGSRDSGRREARGRMDGRLRLGHPGGGQRRKHQPPVLRRGPARHRGATGPPRGAGRQRPVPDPDLPRGVQPPLRRLELRHRRSAARRGRGPRLAGVRGARAWACAWWGT